MNFASILALIVQAAFTRSAAFAITVGGRHLLVTISQNAAAGATNIFSILQAVGSILAGSVGTFTFGALSVVIQELQAAA
jgi:hypothetical protein